MTRVRPGRRARAVLPKLTPAEEERLESLTVAMALAPGVYARNRMFALFANPAVQRAKARAAALRGIVKHLGRATAITLAQDGEFVLRYEIPTLRLSRVAELSRVELATLRLLAVRADARTDGTPCLAPEAEDRALVETALARLLLAGEEMETLARAVAPPLAEAPSAG